MLAGLIFATHDADDRPGQLAATLPFGGATLIEFQARLLAAAGAAQLVIVVARVTPELLGAINRIARRVGTVDAVRTVTEAAEKLHPLARVLAVADGVVTTADTIALVAGEGPDMLLTVDDRLAGTRYERIGATGAWAGLARVSAKRIAEVATMPRDYDFQSALLRAAAQAGAVQLPLPPDAAATHVVERDSRALAERGKAVLSALVPRPARWADRFVVAPIIALLLPRLIARTAPGAAPLGVGIGFSLTALAGFATGWDATALILASIAGVAFATGAALAWLRDEPGFARAQRLAAAGTLALGAGLIAYRIAATGGIAMGWLAASALIVAAALLERAGSERIAAAWWASPQAYPLVMLPVTLFAGPLVALIFAALYAAVTLAAAIEVLREKP